jgi:hypothetical protein
MLLMVTMLADDGNCLLQQKPLAWPSLRDAAPAFQNGPCADMSGNFLI